MVLRGTVVVVVGSAAADELDDDPAEAAAVVGRVVADAEWAVVSAAARMPSPTALADAATATAAVIRRTRDIARFRVRIAG